MPFPSVTDIVTTDLFSPEEQLRASFPAVADRVLRLRALYNWLISNPETKDKDFVDTAISRFNISKTLAYDDLKIIKSVLPNLTKASRDYHRWKYNEMILETYQMAKKRKDTKTMERAASSYAKFNNVNLIDEQTLPYDKIVVQPFTATQDPSYLGIKPMPNCEKFISDMINKYRADCIDIDDIECEEADIVWAEYEEITESSTDNPTS